MKRISKKVWVPVPLVIAVFAAATLWTPGTVGAQTSTTAASGTTTGVTPNEIKIGGITVTSSASGYAQPGVDVGFRARVERENRAGGVHKRKINYIGAKNDELIPAKDLQVARELVQQDGVFLVAPYVTPVSTTGGAFLLEQKVPFLGWGVTPAWCGNDYGFGYDGCLFTNPADPNATVSTLQGSTIAALLKKQGKKPKGMTVAHQGEDSPAGKASLPNAKRAYEYAGFDVVYAESNVPAATADWTPYVQKIMTSDNGGPPDIVNAGMTLQNALGLSGALRAAGFKGIIAGPLFYDASILENPTSKQAAEGAYAYTNYAPIEEKTAATKQLVADVRKSAGKDTVVDYQIEVGYWIADMMIEMLKAAGPNLTRESFLAAANNISVGLEGGYGPTKYPESHNIGGSCGALVQVKGDKFVSKVPFKCYPRTTFTGA